MLFFNKCEAICIQLCMSVCVFMCVCMYVCINIYIYVCVCVCVCVCMYIHRKLAALLLNHWVMCVCVCMYIYIYICVCVCVCVYSQKVGRITSQSLGYVCVCVFVCVCVCIYIYMCVCVCVCVCILIESWQHYFSIIELSMTLNQRYNQWPPKKKVCGVQFARNKTSTLIKSLYAKIGFIQIKK